MLLSAAMPDNQMGKLQAEAQKLTEANGFFLAIRKTWVPPGPNDTPQTIDLLTQIADLSASIASVARQLLAGIQPGSGGIGGGTGGGPLGGPPPA